MRGHITFTYSRGFYRWIYIDVFEGISNRSIYVIYATQRHSQVTNQVEDHWHSGLQSVRQRRNRVCYMVEATLLVDLEGQSLELEFRTLFDSLMLNSNS